VNLVSSAVSPPPILVLASSSRYRRELLARLGFPFTSADPDLDEAALPGEAPEAQVRRLAEAKARAVARAHPAALVIGADQLAVAGGSVLSKPGVHEQAVRQLRAMRGREVTFYTGLCLLNAATGAANVDCVPFGVRFRDFSDEEIERYLRRECPYQCAGSFMSEGLGISLVERLVGDDPSALIGLPLVRLSAMLRAAGVPVP
jgi:septum formation protein